MLKGYLRIGDVWDETWAVMRAQDHTCPFSTADIYRRVKQVRVHRNILPKQQTFILIRDFSHLTYDRYRQIEKRGLPLKGSC